MQRAKRYAAATGQSLTDLIAFSLRQTLDQSERDHVDEPVSLSTYAGTGLLDGVDLEDRHGVLDLMDGIG